MRSVNRITQVQNPQGDRTSYSYDNASRRTLKKLANGTRASFAYDPAGNLTKLYNLKSDGAVISSFDYQYDKVGNRTAVLEADGSRVTWTYDATYQLTGEHRSGSNAYRDTYTYDPTGNRLVKIHDGARTTSAYDAANQLRSTEDVSGRTTYTFDADGNQQRILAPNGDRTTYVWDYENRMSSVQLPSGIRNTMAYEPEGLRVKLEESTGTKKFVWDEQNYLAETDGSNDTQVVYTNEPRRYGNLVSQRRLTSGVWTPHWYHFDAIGSTRELTTSGQVVSDTRLYDAWGVIAATAGTAAFPFQYTGCFEYYRDSDALHQYVRERYYYFRNGRWLSVDPVGLPIDDLYRYAGNRPLVAVDASGRALVVILGPTSSLSPRCPMPSATADFLFYVHKWPCRGDTGYFVQHVSVRCRRCRCGGAPPGGCPTDEFDYFEAWKVTRGFGTEHANDTAQYAAPSDIGQYVQEGEVRFFCGKPKLKKDEEFLPGEIEDIRWPPGGGMGPAGCNTTAGILPRIRPNPPGWEPDFWKAPAVPADGPAFRSFRLEWDCCGKNNCADASASAWSSTGGEPLFDG